MVQTKKRRKSSRFRGSLTHGRGGKKKARGKGHKGGKGMSGTGKRGDQKKTLVLNLYGNDYFGKDKALRGRRVQIRKAISLRNIVEGLDSGIKKGKIKHANGIYEVSLPEYKILGEGEVSVKMKITARAASESAMSKVKKAGGEIIFVKADDEE